MANTAHGTGRRIASGRVVCRALARRSRLGETTRSVSDGLGGTLTEDKRKSFSNILRWRREDDAPPLPTPPSGVVLTSAARPPQAASSDDNYSLTTTATRSSNASKRGSQAAYASSTLLPYVPSHRGSRLGSNASLPRHSLSISHISTPLPGIGDVPDDMPLAVYDGKDQAADIGLAVSASDSIGKRASRQRVSSRLSVQTVQTAPANRQSVQTLRAIITEESSFFKDAEIAALLSDSRTPPRHSPNTSGSVTPRATAPADADSPPPPLPEKPANFVMKRGRKTTNQKPKPTHVIEAPTPIVPRSELSQIGPSRLSRRDTSSPEPSEPKLAADESCPREPRLNPPESRPESLLSTVSWGSAASSQAQKTLRPMERVERSPSPRAASIPEEHQDDTREDLSEQTTPVGRGKSLQTLDVAASMSSAVSYKGISNLLTPVTSSFSGLSPSPSYSDLSDGMRTPSASTHGVLTRTPSSIREIQTLKMRNSTLEVHNARLEFEVMRAAQRPASSYHDLRSSIETSSDGTNYNYDYAVPALLAEIDALKRNGQMLQAELFAVKSQVSLLFPPTPSELSKQEQELAEAEGYPFTPKHEIPADSPPPDDDRSSSPTPTDTTTPTIRPVDSMPSMLIESCPSPCSSYSHSSRSSVAPLTPDTSHEWSPLVLPPARRDSTVVHKETLEENAELDTAGLDARLMTTSSGTPLTNLPPRVASKQPSARMAAQIAAAPGLQRPRSQQPLRAQVEMEKPRPATVVDAPSVPTVAEEVPPAPKVAPVATASASPAPPRPPRRSTLRRKVALGEVTVAELEELRRLRLKADADDRRTPSFTAF